MRIAFLFPGQGAQYVGMGKEFYDNYTIAKQTYEEANDRLGFNISKVCFEGSEEELEKTENTQPAILTTSIAILRVLQQEGYSCDYTAGLSLGEYSALVNAESINFSDAVKLVQSRGIYMQQVVPNDVGKMGAIVGLSQEQLCKVLEHSKEYGIIEVANYNTQEQIVLSGEKSAIKGAIKKAKELGAKKALLLPVSAPFHCSLLQPAGELLKSDLEKIEFNNPKVPLINNVDAKVIVNKDEILPSLVRQVSNSVLWRQSVELMLSKGVKYYIEMGPGTALSNFVKAIAANFKIEVLSESVGDLEGLEKIKKVMQNIN